jgi:hypothetical protein
MGRRVITGIVDGYWAVLCGDCSGTGVFVHPHEPESTWDCVPCRSTGLTWVCLAKPQTE